MSNKIIKQIVSILLIITLISPMINVSADQSTNDFLDIEQTIYDRGFPIRDASDGSWGIAQSFIPDTDVITRVEIYLREFGTAPFYLTVELREDDPEGTLLDSKTYNNSQVPNNWTWFEVDFEDENVSSGTEYFIVIPPPGDQNTSFGYEWGYAFGNQYQDGDFWYTRDDGTNWRSLPTKYECTFKTYGMNTNDTEVLIIHDDDATFASDLKDYYNERGYNAEQIDIDTIEADPECWVDGRYGDQSSANPFYVNQTIPNPSLFNDTAAILRNYIRKSYAEKNTKYVVIIGHQSTLSREFDNDGTSGVCDMLYYSCLNGTQNSDNGDFDESGLTDFYPDVCVGRIPTSISTYQYNMLAKFENYSTLQWQDSGARTLGLYYEENDAGGDGEYDDYDYLWTDNQGLQWSVLNGYDNGNIYTFVNGTGVAGGQIGAFENSITKEQKNNDLRGILNGDNATHPQGLFFYTYKTHNDFGLPAYSGSLDNPETPFFLSATGCGVGDQSGNANEFFDYLNGAGGVAAFTGRSFSPIGGSINRQRYKLDMWFAENKTIGDHAHDFFTHEINGGTSLGFMSYNYFGDPTLRFPYHEVPLIVERKPSANEIAQYGLVNISGKAFDFQQDQINTIELWTNASDSWQKMEEWTNVDSGTQLYKLTHIEYFSEPETTYFYSWNVSDGIYWWNATNTFETSVQAKAQISECYPFYDVPSTPDELSFTVNGYAGHIMMIHTMAYDSSNNTWWQIDYYESSEGKITRSVTETDWITENNTLYKWSINISFDGAWKNKSMPIYITNSYQDPVEHHYPISDIDTSTGWRIYPSGMMYEAVDEETADINTTYVQDSDKYPHLKHWFGIGDFNQSITNISALHLNIVTYNEFGTAKECYFYFGIRNATKPENAYNISYLVNDPVQFHQWKTYSFNMTYNPITGERWTRSDCDNVEVMIGVSAASNMFGRFTQLDVGVSED